MKDRNAQYSISTVLVTLFLGFTIGFIACHSVYDGMDRVDVLR